MTKAPPITKAIDSSRARLDEVQHRHGGPSFFPQMLEERRNGFGVIERGAGRNDDQIRPRKERLKRGRLRLDGWWRVDKERVVAFHFRVIEQGVCFRPGDFEMRDRRRGLWPTPRPDGQGSLWVQIGGNCLEAAVGRGSCKVAAQGRFADAPLAGC